MSTLKKKIAFSVLIIAMMQLFSNVAFAQGESGAEYGIKQVQQYGFAIGILAMLLVGFGSGLWHLLNEKIPLKPWKRLIFLSNFQFRYCVI